MASGGNNQKAVREKREELKFGLLLKPPVGGFMEGIKLKGGEWEMDKINKRIQNLIDVMNLALARYEQGTREIVDFMNTNWYREHWTILKTLLFAKSSIEGKQYTIDYKADGNIGIEVI